MRFSEVEAAHITINMSEERLLDSVNVTLQIPFLERFTFDRLSPEKEKVLPSLLKSHWRV